jgi:hypothetical protein
MNGIIIKNKNKLYFIRHAESYGNVGFSGLGIDKVVILHLDMHKLLN